MVFERSQSNRAREFSFSNPPNCAVSFQFEMPPQGSLQTGKFFRGTYIIALSFLSPKQKNQKLIKLIMYFDLYSEKVEY